jgi:hypothetical protein
MKLRNKKTGEIVDGWAFVPAKYNSLAELNEEWEDYKPAEPLIKDEKIRKAVRAWADMNKIEKAGIQKIITEARGLEDSWYQITGQDKNGCLWKIEIHASYSETVSNDYKGETVPITELCGEGEECES